MTNRSTASHDAARPGVCWNTEETVFWLQPHSARPANTADNGSGRQLFLKLTATLGLGAFISFGTPGTAFAPSTALAADMVNAAGARSGAPVEKTSEKTSEKKAAATAAQNEKNPAAATKAHAVEIDLPEVEPASTVPLAVVTLARATESGAGTASAVTDRDQQIHRDPSELLQFGDMQVPRWIVETILRASEVTGVDPVYMMALADKESSFLPDSKARTSSAEGLFQFLSGTWLDTVRRFGAKHGLSEEAAAIKTVNGQLTVADDAMRERILDLRRDPYLSALMAAEMKKRDRELIERRLGRTISRSEFYLAHFFGVNSASKFMSLLDGKPKQSAPRVFPAAARANKSLFFAKAKKGRKTRQLTVAEVYSKIDAMIDKRLDRYEDVAEVVTADASL